LCTELREFAVQAVVAQLQIEFADASKGTGEGGLGLGFVGGVEDDFEFDSHVRFGPGKSLEVGG
jgi:hypothetical protein